MEPLAVPPFPPNAGILGAAPFQPYPYNITAQVNFMGFELFGHDILLLFLSPIAGVFGALSFFLFVASTTLEKPRADEPLAAVSLWRRLLLNVGNFFGHVGLGLMIGLLVALLFLGSLQPQVSAIGKVLALSMLLGYQAPNIWRLQERYVSKSFEQLLKDLRK